MNYVFSVVNQFFQTTTGQFWLSSYLFLGAVAVILQFFPHNYD